MCRVFFLVFSSQQSTIIFDTKNSFFSFSFTTKKEKKERSDSLFDTCVIITRVFV